MKAWLVKKFNDVTSRKFLSAWLLGFFEVMNVRLHLGVTAQEFSLVAALLAFFIVGDIYQNAINTKEVCEPTEVPV